METRNVKDVLLTRLEELEGALDDADAGSETYCKIMTEIHKVTNDLNEIAKVEVEAEKIYYQQDRDRKDRIIRIAEIGGKFVLIGGLALGSFYFEKTDSFGSTIGRRLFGNLLPKL